MWCFMTEPPPPPLLGYKPPPPLGYKSITPGLLEEARDIGDNIAFAKLLDDAPRVALWLITI